MFGKKPVESESVNKAVAKAVNYEVSIADLARRSERRAWWVAFGAITMCLLLGGGYYYMLPLKEKVPYIVMADAYTGNTSVSKLQNTADIRNITASEALARSNVARFIISRESYDFAMMGLRDWKTVFALADGPVANEYRQLHAPNNPAAPYFTYGKTRAIRINILSITLQGGNGQPYTGANVRFQRSIYEKSTGQTTLLDNKFAILGFRYNSNLTMADDLRVENPLGFQVTDYRVDTDYVGTPTPPPAAFQAPAAAPVAPAAAPANQQLLPGQSSGQVQGQLPGQPMAQPATPGVNGAAPAQQQLPVTNAMEAPTYQGAQPAPMAPAPNAAPQNNGNGANVR